MSALYTPPQLKVAYMTSTHANSNTRLSGKTMTIKVIPFTHGKCSWPRTSNIQMWTFTYISGTEYYITTEVNGALQYLRIASDSISLVEVSDKMTTASLL